MDGPDPNPAKSTHQAREQLQAVVREIETLVASNLPPDLFFREYLERVALTVGADAAALWRLDGAQGIALQHFVQRVQLELFENAELHQRFRNALRETLSAGGLRIYRLGDPRLAGLPQSHVHVFAVIQVGDAPWGVLHLLLRSNMGEGPGFPQFVERLCGYVPQYLKNREHPVIAAGAPQKWQDFEAVAIALHGTLEVAEVASIAANDAARYLGCDRLSVIERYGARLRVLAVTGQESVNSRSNQVRTLRRLAEVVLAGGERLQYTGNPESLPPQLEEPLAEFLEISRTRFLSIVPLVPREKPRKDGASGSVARRRPESPKPVGALVVEQVAEAWRSADFDQRMELVSTHLTQALLNAQQVERLPLLPAWRAVSRVLGTLRGRRLAQCVAVITAMVVLASVLVFVRWDYRVEGTGRLMPVARQGIFAPWDGQVVEILAESGQHVEQGQLLLRLQNDELRARRLSVESEFDEKRKQLLAFQAELAEGARNLSREEVIRLQGKIAQTRIETEGAQKRLAALTDLEKSLDVHVPLAGVVATFQISQLLAHRPVHRGELLVEVMDETGPWRLELEVSEQRMGHLLIGQEERGAADLPVEFVLATAPETTYPARVEATATRTVTSEEEGNIVEVFATLDGSLLPQRRIGAEVTAKINCGQRSLGYVLFGDVIEFVRRHWWW